MLHGPSPHLKVWSSRVLNIPNQGERRAPNITVDSEVCSSVYLDVTFIILSQRTTLSSSYDQQAHSLLAHAVSVSPRLFTFPCSLYLIFPDALLRHLILGAKLAYSVSRSLSIFHCLCGLHLSRCTRRPGRCDPADCSRATALGRYMVPRIRLHRFGFH